MFNWGDKNNTEAVRFLQKGVRGKYTMTIKGEIHMGTMNTTSVSQCRWVLNVLDVDAKGAELELLTLDTTLLEYSNPSLKDIDALNNMFKQIYNDLQFHVGLDGKLTTIHNLAHIKQKWQQVRTQLVEIQGQFMSIAQVLKLNDDLFANEKLLYQTIEATEFFEWYIGLLYGKDLQKSHNVIKKSRFQIADVAWIFEYEKAKQSPTPDIDRITVRGSSPVKKDLSWLKSAYGHFPYIDINTIRPNYITEAEYFVHKNTGLVAEANIKTEEVIHPGLLYSKLHFHIKSDDFEAPAPKKDDQSQKRFSTQIE